MIPSSLLLAVLAAAPRESRPPFVDAPPPAPAQDEVAPEELPAWKGSVTVGGKYTGGNTETQSITSQLDAERRDERDRWTFKAWWNYGEQKVSSSDPATDGDLEISVRNAGGSVKYDYFATERLYYLGIAGIETDTLAGLDLRWYAGPGLGYQFIEDEKTTLLGEAALTYFAEKFDSGDEEETVALRLAYKLGRQLTATSRFDQDLTLFPSVEDIEDFYGKLDTRLRADLTKSMFAQLQNILDYDNTPATFGFPEKRVLGAHAERLDNQILLTIGWSF